MERILLNRLMDRLEDKLSPRLFGFLPERSNHHCLPGGPALYSHLSSSSVVDALDLKGAFDIANKDIILDHLVDLNIKGNLLTWIRVISNKASEIFFFDGAYSTSHGFEFRILQYGVLCPFLLKILMHLIN